MDTDISNLFEDLNLEPLEDLFNDLDTDLSVFTNNTDKEKCLDKLDNEVKRLIEERNKILKNGKF